MEIQPDIDIFVGNSTIIDYSLYELWLKQISVSEAIEILIADGTKAPSDLIRSDVLDQFRTLGLLEKYIKNPLTLGQQLSFQLTPEIQNELITRYYSFDDVVLRELLGKKLSRSTYQNMDDVSSKTSVRLKSCLRQFDNCRRVFKHVEEMSGNLVENIEKQFLLPRNLSWAYATVVFLANHRFECTKRRLNYLSLDDFIVCSQLLIENWTYGAGGSTAVDMDVDIDREFLHELRGIKFIASDKEISEKCKALLSNTNEFMSCTSATDVDALCRQLCRSIPGIASGLYRTKELRDFFVDVTEKIIDPAKVAKWSPGMLSAFLSSLSTVVEDCYAMQSYKSIWLKYITTHNNCILQLYHS